MKSVEMKLDFRSLTTLEMICLLTLFLLLLPVFLSRTHATRQILRACLQTLLYYEGDTLMGKYSGKASVRPEEFSSLVSVLEEIFVKGRRHNF
jgi:hypothetical protein